MPSSQEIADAVWRYGIPNFKTQPVDVRWIVAASEGRTAAVQAALDGLTQRLAALDAKLDALLAVRASDPKET